MIFPPSLDRAHSDVTTRRQADHEGECSGGESSVAATIAWVSEGERAKPRRRRGRRRGRRSAGPPEAVAQPTNPAPSADHTKPRHSDGPAKPGDNGHKPAPARRAPDRLRTVHETSAGGLVIDGIDGPKDGQVAALIGRVDRRGRMLWSLPKGHIELGETAEQTAIREVAEETGIQGSVLAALGSIDYWFVTEGRRVHKTVHHYLLRFLGGELSDEDVEVSEVAWVPLHGASRPAGLRRRAAPGRGRRGTDRPAALRRPGGTPAAAALLATAPRPDPFAHPKPSTRRLHATPETWPAGERLRPGSMTRRAVLTAWSRLLAVAAVLTLIAAPALLPRAAAGRTRLDPLPRAAHRPRHARRREHHERSHRHRGGHRDQRRRPTRSRRHGAPRARRGGVVVGGPSHQPGRQRRPVRGGGRLHHGGAGVGAGPERPVHAVLSGAFDGTAVAEDRPARRLPRVGQRQRHARLRGPGAPRRRPLPAARARRATRPVHRCGGPAVGRSCRPTRRARRASPCCGRWPTGPASPRASPAAPPRSASSTTISRPR